MESLYTKYRPQTFQDVVGQQVVVSTLENAVLEGRTGHAYLFCGPRGTGKTTMARLLAKALMCEGGPNKLPDGTCEQCKLIAAGEHPDVYELDAASRTGVDNVREEIINRVGYAPVRGRYKVYIIDEVHMLTTAAFNALLKTLEEPPEHVVFILCTTDPQKIPATIISRVQRFDFHAISNDEIRQRLTYVCQHEGFTYDDEALDLVVRHARGGMRDALSTLEQLSVFGNGTISLEAAQDMLGSVPGSTLSKTCEALASRDVATLYEEVGSLVDGGRDLLQFVRELAARVRDVYVVSVVGAKEGVISASADELSQLEREAQQFGSPDRLAHVLTVLGDASNEMRTATNQRLSLEIAFTRIARPEADLTLDALADRVAQLEAEVQELKENGVAPARPTAFPVAATPQPDYPSASAAEKNESQEPMRPDAVQASPAARGPVVVPTPSGVASAPTGATRSGTASSSASYAPARPAPHEQSTAGSTGASAPMATASPTQATASRGQSAPAHAGAPSPAQTPTPTRVSASVGTARPATAAPQARYSAPAAASAGGASGVSSAAGSGITNPGELQRRWRQAVDTLIKRIPSRGSLLMSSSIVSDDGNALVVSLPKGSTFALKMLDRADVRQAIEPYIGQVFGGARTLNFVEEAPQAAARPVTPRPAARPARPATTSPSHAPQMPSRQASQTTTTQSSTPPSANRYAGTRPGAQPDTPYPSPTQRASTQAAAGAAAPTHYDMPWDPVPTTATPSGTPATPTASPFEEPPREEVPYDDADAMSYGDDIPTYEEPAPRRDPAATAPSRGNVHPNDAGRTLNSASTSGGPSSGAASSGRAMAGAQAQAGAEAQPQAQTPSQPQAQAPLGSEPPATFDADSIPDDIPDDLRSIIEDCFEVFGDGVKVSSVQPAPSQDEMQTFQAGDASGDAGSSAINLEADSADMGYVDDAENGNDEDDDG